MKVEKERKLVLVKWKDSSVCDDWNSISTHFEAAPVDSQTVGFVIAETKEHITLTWWISDKDCRGRVTIPKFAIQSISEL